MPEGKVAPKSRGRQSRRTIESRLVVPLVLFGILVLFGPLVFGAVDRKVQMILVLILAVGATLSPPAMVAISSRGRKFLIALVAVLFVKEFAPHLLFGSVRWRPEAEAVGLRLPWSHHPEPARAFDWLLTAVVAGVWLQWVRTLAADRAARILMTWILFLAGVVFAAVCFVMRANLEKGGAILGLNFGPGWGLFPNRNHTASLLSMTASVGAGCLAWAIGKERKPAMVAGASCLLLVIAALVGSHSRGGLLAFGVGLAIFCGMLLWKHRDRRTVKGIAVGLILVALCLAAFGTQVPGHFKSEAFADMSNQLRIDIWRNSIAMWKDAPLLGHGADTFTGLFPFYQNLKLDDNVVLHPESSWLQWLTELGAVPVIMFGIAFCRLVIPGLRGVFERESLFSLGAGAFAGLGAILAHGLIDVPAHRWGTAGYALALLGLACPVGLSRDAMRMASPRAGLVPLAIGIFWLLPFAGRGPAWETAAPGLLRARELGGGVRRPQLGEWQQALRYFPLAPDMHHFAGLRELEAGIPAGAEWQKHFEIVHRLVPGGWRYPITHARAVKRLSPMLCVQYWQLAIERSDWRGFELLGDAVRDTAGLGRAGGMWADYVAANPKFGLAYARLLPDEEGRPFYEAWWESRGKSGEVSDAEVQDFYVLAPGWVTAEQMEEWIRRQSRRRREDYRHWMALLHRADRDERAWRVFQGVVPEPPYPQRTNQATITDLETKVRLSPENPAHLVELAQAIEQSGDVAGATKIIIDAAGKRDAPAWFLRRCAYLLAAEGRFREAVEMALREK